MHTKISLTAILCLGLTNAFCQEAMDVTEQTVKIGGLSEEVLYFGFAEGDRIIFNFEELDKKELKEIEIVEYPSNPKFSDYKTGRIENKSISVFQKGIYIFKFKNSAVTGRICRIRVQRVPASEATRNFNTSVKWVDKHDTTWNVYTKDVVVGHDTSYVSRSRRELVRIDTTFTQLFDKVMRVHSYFGAGTQYTSTEVNLPRNTYYPTPILPYKSTEVVAWSYWLGVGPKAKEDYEKANKNLVTGIKAIGSLTGYGALASLAATGISMFRNTTLGDNVQYKFYGYQNGQQITIDHGDVVSASGRNDQIKQGTFNIQLYNDNTADGIDVDIKIVVMQVTRTWQDIAYQEQKISPRTEKQIFKDPIIVTTRVPVFVS